MTDTNTNTNTKRVRLRTVILISAFAFAYGLLGGADVSDAKDRERKIDTVQCTEDMDCWDCETMGNLICGDTRPDYAP